VASLLGSQGSLKVDEVEDRDLSEMLPESKKRAYDVHPLGRVHPRRGHAQELTSDGRPTSSPRSAASAAARSVSWPTTRCARRLPRLAVGGEGLPLRADVRRFGVPLIVVVDVPGYLPGVGQEWDGVVAGREAAARVRRVRGARV
jgi:acetyl-CoA/propionyl-CoA carboxylase carboxyl transferase subunit